MCFETGKQTYRTETYTVNWYTIDRPFLSYKMLCYVKPKGLGLITDMSLIYILAWIWSTNNQHLDRFSYLSSFDCYVPTHTHTHARARTHTRAHTHTLILHECETVQVLIHTFPPGAREGWGFLDRHLELVFLLLSLTQRRFPLLQEQICGVLHLQTPANTQCERLRTAHWNNSNAVSSQVTLICTVCFTLYVFESSFT